jgi:hypothetical protein
MLETTKYGQNAHTPAATMPAITVGKWIVGRNHQVDDILMTHMYDHPFASCAVGTSTTSTAWLFPQNQVSHTMRRNTAHIYTLYLSISFHCSTELCIVDGCGLRI